jgi:hypothetical protein
LVIVAAVVVAAAVLDLQASRQQLGGSGRSVSAIDHQGPFTLTIESDSDRYLPSDAVSVRASLTYAGPEAQIQISHGQGTPLGFGIVEPVSGFQLSPAWRLSCETSALVRGAPLTQAFIKSGDSTGGTPDTSALNSFFTDPTLRLPPGTWHVYAVTDFTIGDCGGPPTPRYEMRSGITIVVPDASGLIPSAIPPSPTPDSGDLPIAADAQDGPIQLTLTSPHRRYKAGDPIEVTAGLTMGGPNSPITTYGSSSLGPVAFEIRQLDGPVVIGNIGTTDCNRQTTLQPDQTQTFPFRKTAPASGADSGTAFWQTWLADPVLRLPVGRWEITASTDFSLAPGCSDPAPDLKPTIEIDVVP